MSTLIVTRISGNGFANDSAVTDAGSLGEDAHFTSRNEDRISSVRVPLLTSADIVSLPIGQAFCLLNGSHLYKIRIPLASKKDDEAAVILLLLPSQQRYLLCIKMYLPLFMPVVLICKIIVVRMW